MSTQPTDLDHLRHLAQHAEAAEASRARQRELEEKACAEQAHRLAVAKLTEAFELLFGPRTAARLGITFVYDDWRERAVARYIADGEERHLLYDHQSASVCIYQAYARAQINQIRCGTLPKRFAEADAERQRERADQLILALAKTFAPDEAEEA
ncbi:MAG: hypothetical protein HGA45_37120 [Chloroflexales bacterium]|nr:hypothetical protein [Chloroflexales bacterium]